RIHEISKPDDFVVRSGAEEFRAPALVVATGGLSIPKMGATSFGYEIAKQFGLKIQPTRPALVPLTFSEKDKRRYCDLTRVYMKVIAQTEGASFREKMLITHRGVSGPAILQASSYWQPKSLISIDLAPDHEVTSEILQAKTRNESALKNAFIGVL